MVITATIVALIVLRKMNIIMDVSIIEATISQKTPFIERMMNFALSCMTARLVPGGAVWLSSLILSLTMRERRTSLAPFCLRICTITVGLPSRMAPLPILVPSDATPPLATSLSLITAPFLTATGRYSSSATEEYSPSSLIPYSLVAVSIRPAGSSTCFV